MYTMAVKISVSFLYVPIFWIKFLPNGYQYPISNTHLLSCFLVIRYPDSLHGNENLKYWAMSTKHHWVLNGCTIVAEMLKWWSTIERNVIERTYNKSVRDPRNCTQTQTATWKQNENINEWIKNVQKKRH